MSLYFLKIDEDGFLLQDNVRLSDPAFGKPILENIFLKGRTYCSKWQDKEVQLEAFDAPLVAQSVSIIGHQLNIRMPYGFDLQIDPETLCVDEWDRFHSHQPGKPPIVFSRKAQIQFFNLLEEFDDDSITIGGKIFPVRSFLPDISTASKSEFWSEKYQDWKATDTAPGWDQNEPAKFLHDVLPQLKILKQRVAVLGCGAGHDAAHFASLGHLVTAFDISADAIAKAKEKYPESNNLKYIQMDLLNPRKEFLGQFDLVFEHTFFCAINPKDRTTAIKTMHQLMSNEGHLLADFFVITPVGGPPFGATEWELRQRIEGKFKPLYWTRWRKSPEARNGWELIVYAKKVMKF